MELELVKEFKVNCPECAGYVTPIGKNYFCTLCGKIYKEVIAMPQADEDDYNVPEDQRTMYPDVTKMTKEELADYMEANK